MTTSVVRRLGLATGLAVLAVAALCALAVAPALAVSPSPHLLKLMARDKTLATHIKTHLQTASANGVDAPARHLGVAAWPDAALRAATGGRTVSGTLKSLAIVVDFSDEAHAVSASEFDDLLFKDVSGPVSVRGYYHEVSYGTLDIITVDLPSSVGWLRLPRTLAYYAGNNYGTDGPYPQNAQKLVEDAIAAADPLVDFSQYDNDGDGYVDNLFVIHAGQGAEYTGRKTDIWSHSWETSSPVRVDGVWASTYSMEPEYWVSPGDMTTGVYAHEMGHVLGLPDLYDRDYSSSGVGDWSLMAHGSWNGLTSAGGDLPARLDAWCSMRLGWLQPALTTSAPATRSLVSVASSATGSAVKIYPNGASAGNEYFLVENRQLEGTDAALPGSGLLIWHVDESRIDPADWNDDASHKLVDLEEADGTQSMDSKLDNGTAADPFPGTNNDRTFNDSTNPNARTYTGTPTSVVVDQIGNSGPSMSARIGVGSAAPDTTPPVTTDDHASVPAVAPMTITLTPTDTGSGMSGGSARTEYKVDGAPTYTVGTTVVLDQGTHTVAYRSTDAAGNVETPDKSFTVTVAAGAPVSSSTYDFAPDATSQWLRTAQSVTITVTGGSGTGRQLHYSTNGGGSWTTAAATAPVTFTVSTQGPHHVLFYASDSVAEETQHDAGYVNIDGVRPVTRATAASVRWGRTVTLRFRANDGPRSSGRAIMTLQVKRGALTLLTVPLGTRATNATISYRFAAILPRGTYRYRVLATDVAGNAARRTIWAQLKIT